MVAINSKTRAAIKGYEVATEELPASFLGDAILQSRSRIPQSL
ncbi:hypothetical protein NWP22_03895 [Anabaenopsis tanganyikae CS-531]|uniref:Uncharacterized protein n=1 Tax=Anabaenopsis tanganyikae CS-531 TaxID=2785304 RepID=A0ABT6KBP2_9CYAN|nr:hypothetical protein [Anabaenopsis tanganyikae]MDH6105020.1 hypothetical protein [Anabaenopsis tanganyikae CS-531]